MEQVLLNLTLNARDAMPQGGTLTLETAAVRLGRDELAECEPGPYVRLTVRDSGHGVPADLAGRIFEPFVTTKAEGRGSGLGLAIVSWIVRQHRGGVMVESAPGAGAAFRILLPRAEEGEERPPALDARTALRGGGRQ
jgi:signal transduction histidine kinase